MANSTASVHTTATQRPATAPRPPADPHAVLSFLAAGHTTLETAQRFSITERSVRRIRQRQDERDEHTRRVQRMAAHHPAERPVARAVDTMPLPTVPTFAPPNPHELAGQHTLWRCPVSGELTPVPPGAKRGEWEAERHNPTPRQAPAPDPTDGPDTLTGQPFAASESATDSGPAAVQPPPPSAQLDNTLAPVLPPIVKRYPPRPAPRPPHAEMVAWARENLFAPSPALAVLAFLLLLLWLGVR